MMPKTNRLGVRKYSVAAGATRRVSRERWIARKAHRRGHGVGGYPEKRPQPTFCGSFLAAIPSGRAWFHQQKHASDAFNAHNRAGRGGLVHRTVASIARQVRNACFAGNFPARRLMQPYARSRLRKVYLIDSVAVAVIERNIPKKATGAQLRLR